jgi:hypothetical protein
MGGVSDSPYAQRWAESRAYLKLCAASIREGDYSTALNWLHEAHNLARDHTLLHAKTHFRYVKFSLHEANYPRALGHLFWALSSPLMVPVERRQRTAIIGRWKPAPRALETPAAVLDVNDSPIGIATRAPDGH